jgi:general secretion pathway protein D
MRFLVTTLLSLLATTTQRKVSPAPVQEPLQAVPPASGQSPRQGEVPSTMPPGTSVILSETPKERMEAKRDFKEGTSLKSAGKLDLAFAKFEKAAELCPHNLDYIIAREFTRQQLVMQALERGNKAMLEHKDIIAMAEFRQALEYDPTNDFAVQRLRDSIPEELEPAQGSMRVVEQSTPIELQPSTAHHDFHFRGDARTLLTQVAQTYGIVAEFDPSVQQRRVHFDIEDVNFATAMDAATHVTKTFWVALSSRQMLFAADTVENRRSLERMSLRTFYLPDIKSDQQLNETLNSLRILFNLRFIVAQKSQSTITIRAEEPIVEAIARLLESLSAGTPEVMLDMHVYEISSTLARQIGTGWPTQFTMFSINRSLLTGLGQNAQNLINQLIASGGINQANSTAIQALLGQLANQSNSILSQPFATFGGGLTLFGLTSGGTGLTVTLSLNDANLRSLEHVMLRAGQNDAAVLKIGERYPIVNATFAPIYNSPAISQVVGNATYIAPFPSFSFEDLGLILKATPLIHGNRDITLKLDLAIRSLGTQNVNGIPIINNREYSGTISVKDGESSVVTGLLSREDMLNMTGWPFFSQVPGLTYAASEHNKNAMDDELMVVITPHLVRRPPRDSFAEMLPREQ